MDAIIRQTLHVTLRRTNRSTVDDDDGGGDGVDGSDGLRSFLVTNLTVVLPDGMISGRKFTGNAFEYSGGGGSPKPGGAQSDKAGAGYYVMAVLLVYSMSVVALLASHIKRKHVKILEDREIHKYLREFQVVKEKSTRDSYQNLKSAVIARLSKERSSHTYRNLSRSVLPLLAVALPTDRSNSTTAIPPSSTGIWESNVGFYLGTHPSGLPTLQESNIDELGYPDSHSPGSRPGSWTDQATGLTRVHRQKISKKSGSLDATVRLSKYGYGGGGGGGRWPPRKVRSEIAIDPTLLADGGGGGRAVGFQEGVPQQQQQQQRPVCIDFEGISCEAFEYSPSDEQPTAIVIDEISPLTDNRPETETMSLADDDDDYDDDVISVSASPILLPRDVIAAQTG